MGDHVGEIDLVGSVGISEEDSDKVKLKAINFLSWCWGCGCWVGAHDRMENSHLDGSTLSSIQTIQI